MTKDSAKTGGVPNDAMLVAESLGGNRDAFAQIVARHQSLICSLAFSATGSLADSEDLAQETFLTAWRRLRDLRNPAALRSWLCQIARNLASSLLRRQGREPAHAAGPIDETHNFPALEPLPTEQVISREEEAILWRSLERIPESYREPLILFYREHQSIERVSAALQLSESAVKQRLSRGRRLLHERVTAFVESALERTNPGVAFTLAVVAALPLLPAPVEGATLGATVAKSGAAGKSAGWIASWSLFFWGAVLAVLGGGCVSAKAQAEDAKSPRERQFRIRWGWTCMALALLLVLGWRLAVTEFNLHLVPPGLEVAKAALMLGLAIIFITQIDFLHRRIHRIRAEEGTGNEPEKLAGASTVFLCLGLAKRMAGLLAAVLILALQEAWEKRWVEALAGLLLIPLFIFLAKVRWQGLQQGRKGTHLRRQLAIAAGFCVLTLLQYDLPHFKPSTVSPSTTTVQMIVVFNMGTMLAYAALVGILIKRGKLEETI